MQTASPWLQRHDYHHRSYHPLALQLCSSCHHNSVAVFSLCLRPEFRWLRPCVHSTTASGLVATFVCKSSLENLLREHVPKSFQLQPVTFSSRSCLHSASVGFCKPSRLGEICCAHCSPAVLSAKEHVAQLSLHLLLSAAEAVDHPEDLVPIQMHLKHVIWQRSGLWPR